MDASGSETLIADNLVRIEVYNAERIYNVEETGHLYRCNPHRANVTAGQRRRARGIKALKAKDRVTHVLACNATGTHKIQVTLIGKAKEPVCFKRPRQPVPLQYFSQENAWTDGGVYKSWFETFLLPDVRRRSNFPVVRI